jgi:hypothetical protein
VIDPLAPLRRMPRHRAADLVSAAAYGTVLILGALAVLEPNDVSDGHGLELVAAVGVATWVAHVFSDLLGEQLRHEAPPSEELRWSAVSGIPILAACVLPAVAIGLGRLDAISDVAAIWVATIIGVLQLVGLGAVVGVLKGTGRRTVWRFVLVTCIFGLGVTALKVRLTH